MRANRGTVPAKMAEYLEFRPVSPPPPTPSQPIDRPEALRFGAERALLFERLDGECAIGTCSAIKETRRTATYREEKDGRKI